MTATPALQYRLSYHVDPNPNKRLSYNPSAALVQAAALGTIIFIGSAVAYLGLTYMHSIGNIGQYCLYGAMGVGGAIILANMSIWSASSYKRNRVAERIAENYIVSTKSLLDFKDASKSKMYTRFDEEPCTIIWTQNGKALNCEVFDKSSKADPGKFIEQLKDFELIPPKNPSN